MSSIDYTKLDLSPLEDEGIDYIWFARYFKDNFTKFESNNDKVKLEEEDLRKFKDLLDALDDCEDVQNVYHNVEL